MAEGPFISLGDILLDYSKKITEALKKSLKEHDSIASRKLLQSIAPSVKIFGTTYEMQIKMEDYWEYVDQGRPPGKQPPIEPIIRWLVTKSANKARSLKNKRVQKAFRSKVRKQLKGNALRSSAYLIARSIGKKGTKGNFFASDVIHDETMLNNLKKDISAAIKKDFQIQVKYK